MVSLKHWSLLPGAEVIEVGEGSSATRALVGIPPCLKLFLQRKVAPPTVFVLPDAFFQRGVVQVCLEFFVYHFLFVLGKAFGKLPSDAKLTVIGTPEQLARAKRILEVTLLGFSPEELRRWRMPDGRRALDQQTIAFLRRMRAWFAPKAPGFTPPPLTVPFEERIVAYEDKVLPLDGVIAWVPYDANGNASLGDASVTIHRDGENRFTVRSGMTTIPIDLTVREDQAPFLLTLPPQPTVMRPGVLTACCLGADSGFEIEHPTTGFALSVNGQWAVVDAPVCASHLLRQQGVDPADIRIIVETHGHEDHMGSAMHFLLECVTTGRSYTYVAAEPVYRTCVAKMAAILDVTEEEANRMLTTGTADRSVVPDRQRTGCVVRVRPGTPVRLLGATWEFVYMIHPIPTTGFRITLAHRGQAYTLAYSSDTAPRSGFLGTDAMVAAGFLAPEENPARKLLRGDEALVLWEAGGTHGDPIHFRAQEWAVLAAERGVRASVVLMHTHPLPPEFRHLALARPGMVWTIVSDFPIDITDASAVHGALSKMPVRDVRYWFDVLLRQGEVQRYAPGATVVAEGERGDAWYLILAGSAEVIVGDRRVGLLEREAFFGELALLGGDGLRRATVRAVGPLVVLRVPADVFRDFVLAEDLAPYFAAFWERVGLLRQTRLFLGFPHEAIAALAGCAQRRTYRSGEVIIAQGTVGDELFVIARGDVSIIRREDGGRETAIGTRGVGELIGEVGVFIPGAHRTATVRAVDAVEVLVLTREDIDRIMVGQLPLQLRLIALLRERGISVAGVVGVQASAA